VLLGRHEGVGQTSPSAREMRADVMNDAWAPLVREAPPARVSHPPHTAGSRKRAVRQWPPWQRRLLTTKDKK